MAFKIWCETDVDLDCIMHELEDDCGFQTPSHEDIDAPVGIIVRLDTVNFAPRAVFEAYDAEPYGVIEDCPSAITTFLEDGGGIWISNEKDLELFIDLIICEYKILNKPPKVPCGFYLANPETLAWANNTNHAKYWSNFINGELRTYRSNNSTITTTYSDETEDTITIENWYVEPLTEVFTGGHIQLDPNPMPLSDEELEEIAKRLNRLRNEAEELENPRQAKPHDEDMVNHPNHYANSCSLECIDVIHALLGDEYTYAACLFNAFKYLWRYKHKGHPAEDLDKAAWYLDRAEAISDKTDGYVDDDPLERITELYLAIRRKEKDNG